MEVIAFLVFVAVCLLAYCLYALYRWWRVRVTSLNFKKVEEINSKYSFEAIERILFHNVILNSKREFDRFCPEDYLCSLVEESREYYDDWYNKGIRNKSLYRRYVREIEQLSTTFPDRPSWQEVELRMVKKKMLRPPVDETIVTLSYSYTSPAGRNHYEKKVCFDTAAVCQTLNAVDQLIEQKGTRQAHIRRERAMMTDSVRYEVMRRDGFRCVLCGSRASDGVQLHVDHIMPVSKGGKTELSNLRTLCDRCNMGKRDKIE